MVELECLHPTSIVERSPCPTVAAVAAGEIPSMQGAAFLRGEVEMDQKAGQVDSWVHTQK